MSRREIQSLKPFPFDAEFRPPAGTDAASGPAAAPESVTLAPAELAQMGAMLHAQGSAAAQARIDMAALARLEAVADRLGRAAAQLGEVADLLDRQGGGPRAAGLARLAAQSISDGQGDLFAALDMLGGGEART